MLEVEVFGSQLLADPLPPGQAERLCILALASAGIEHGHIAIQFVDAERIAELNAEHRDERGPTDVLSFPIDGAGDGALAGGAHGEEGLTGGLDLDEGLGGGADGPGADTEDVDPDLPPCELGDIVICPEHTRDVAEAILHGALHLLGMDHETDEGQMLALQAELLRWESE